jgi:hypothetical protein
MDQDRISDSITCEHDLRMLMKKISRTLGVALELVRPANRIREDHLHTDPGTAI